MNTLSPEIVDFLIRAVRRDDRFGPALARRALRELCHLRDTRPSADAALFTGEIRDDVELWRMGCPSDPRYAAGGAP